MTPGELVKDLRGDFEKRKGLSRRDPSSPLSGLFIGNDVKGIPSDVDFGSQYPTPKFPVSLAVKITGAKDRDTGW
ncbi:hypothetical protein ColTof3_10132 [Colletotrichum tofieldiae]|nr:hypothetical protein ColTof3_10132 [Colletotrichum tofieldiae]GKT96543.1 hypothetical protein Ct61P_14393 [Colletotrichum tofieldiae]